MQVNSDSGRMMIPDDFWQTMDKMKTWQLNLAGFILSLSIIQNTLQFKNIFPTKIIYIFIKSQLHQREKPDEER